MQVSNLFLGPAAHPKIRRKKASSPKSPFPEIKSEMGLRQLLPFLLFSSAHVTLSRASQGCQMVYIFADQNKTILIHFWGPWNGHFVYIIRPFGIFKAVWCNLLIFGRFCGHFVYIFPFWYVVPRKIWQPRKIWHPWTARRLVFYVDSDKLLLLRLKPTFS
jgi:hypothetical protein